MRSKCVVVMIGSKLWNKCVLGEWHKSVQCDEKSGWTLGMDLCAVQFTVASGEKTTVTKRVNPFQAGAGDLRGYSQGSCWRCLQQDEQSCLSLHSQMSPAYEGAAHVLSYLA